MQDEPEPEEPEAGPADDSASSIPGPTRGLAPLTAAVMMGRQAARARVHTENHRQPIHVRVERIENFSPKTAVLVQLRVMPWYQPGRLVKDKATNAVFQVVGQMGNTIKVRDATKSGAATGADTVLAITDVIPADDSAAIEPLVSGLKETSAEQAGELASGLFVWKSSEDLTFSNVRAHSSTCLYVSVRKETSAGEELAWSVTSLFTTVPGAANSGKLQLKDGPINIPLCVPPADMTKPLEQQLLGSASVRIHVCTDASAGGPVSRESTPNGDPKDRSRPVSQRSDRSPPPTRTPMQGDTEERQPTHLTQHVGDGVRKVQVSPEAWLHCSNNPPPHAAPFGSSDGIDIYVDGARGLPENATISRAAGTIYNRDFQKVSDGFFGDVHLDSTTSTPIYKLRHEVREASYDATSTLVVVVYTVDKFTQKVGAVGYGVLNLFVDAASRDKAQPANQNVKDYVVNTGGFELKLHKAPPSRSNPLTAGALDATPAVPCATLLVRLRPAAKSKDGLRTLSTADVDERDWVKDGLMQPMPDYRDGMYDSTRAVPTQQAAKLYNYRKLHGAMEKLRLKDELQFVGDGTFQAGGDDDQTTAFIKNSLDLPPLEPEAPIDYSYVAKYNHEEGFWFAVDSAMGLHRTVWCNATHCLAPPASFYSEPSLTDRVHLTLSHQMDSDAKSPVWNDGLIQYRGEAYNANACLIVELHTVESKGVFSKETEVVSLGWSVLPIFKDEGAYIRSGEYKLPVYQGRPSKSFIDDLQFEQPREALAKAIATRRVQLYEFGSVTVRLLDYYRAGEYEKPGGLSPSLEFVEDGMEGKYSGAPKKSKQLANLGASELEMNKLIASSLKIKHYTFG